MLVLRDSLSLFSACLDLSGPSIGKPERVLARCLRQNKPNVYVLSECTSLNQCERRLATAFAPRSLLCCALRHAPPTSIEAASMSRKIR